VKKLKRDEEACRRSRKMEGVRRGPPNAVRHHGEEKEEEDALLNYKKNEATFQYETFYTTSVQGKSVTNF
jgi:hypothetical protein